MEYAKPFFRLKKEIHAKGAATVRNTCLLILCTRKVSCTEQLTQLAAIESGIYSMSAGIFYAFVVLSKINLMPSVQLFYVSIPFLLRAYTCAHSPTKTLR